MVCLCALVTCKVCLSNFGLKGCMRNGNENVDIMSTFHIPSILSLTKQGTNLVAEIIVSYERSG